VALVIFRNADYTSLVLAGISLEEQGGTIRLVLATNFYNSTQSVCDHNKLDAATSISPVELSVLFVRENNKQQDNVKQQAGRQTQQKA
jgi:hypothetical protein